MLPWLGPRLPSQEPFLRREELGPFCGREKEKGTIRDFLASNRLFLVVHGAGGTGKTRLLVDAGDEIAGEGQWQVFWANVQSMAATGSWFRAIAPERDTLLLVDEPSDDALLQQLAEQLGGRVGRMAKWKVVVAVRSPNALVLRFLRLARMKQRVQELPLLPLPASDAEDMCFRLLETGKRPDVPNPPNPHPTPPFKASLTGSQGDRTPRSAGSRPAREGVEPPRFGVIHRPRGAGHAQ